MDLLFFFKSKAQTKRDSAPSAANPFPFLKLWPKFDQIIDKNCSEIRVYHWKFDNMAMVEFSKENGKRLVIKEKTPAPLIYSRRRLRQLFSPFKRRA